MFKMMRLTLISTCLLGLACATSTTLNSAGGPAGAFETSNLDGMTSSIDQVGIGFLDALARSDAKALRAMCVDAKEFERVIWPEMPANKPQANLSADWVWNQYAMRNEAELASLLHNWGGTSLRFVALDFLEESNQYPSFTIHQDSVLTVATAEGQTRKVRLFGSVIEQKGRYKIYGYLVD